MTGLIEERKFKFMHIYIYIYMLLANLFEN